MDSSAEQLSKLQGLVAYVRRLQTPSSVEWLPVHPLLDVSTCLQLPGVEICDAKDAWLRIRPMEVVPPPILPKGGVVGQSATVDFAPVVSPTATPEEQVIFKKWLLEVYKPWQQHSVFIAASNKLYKDLFALLTTLKLDGAAETKEIVCAWGKASSEYKGNSRYCPLLLQSCEVLLTTEGDSSAIEIRPSSSSLEWAIRLIPWLDKEQVPLLDEWIQTRGSQVETAYEEANPLLGTETAPAIQSLAAQCHLEVEESYWAVYVRERPLNRVIFDLEAWQEVLSATPDPEIPAFLRQVVDKDFSAPPSTGESEILLPLPYNDEQYRVLSYTESGTGAVVRGPPGTGKSHTIANVICHYLAHGKKVLVAASSASSLEVIRSKIPEPVRPLVAALLSSDAASLSEFEASLSEIEHHLSNFDAEAVASRIQGLEDSVRETNARLGKLERNLSTVGESSSAWVELPDGQRLPPLEAARRAVGLTFEDLLPQPVPESVPKDVLIALDSMTESVLDLEGLSGESLRFLASSLPDEGKEVPWLPVEEAEAVKTAAQVLVETETVAAQIGACSFKNIGKLPEEVLVRLSQELSKLAAASERLRESLPLACQAWESSAAVAAARVLGDIEVAGALQTLRKQVPELLSVLMSTAGRVALGSSVGSVDISIPLGRLVLGGKAFPPGLGILHAKEQKVLKDMTVDGEAPQSAEDWRLVKSRLDALRQAKRLWKRWVYLAGILNLGVQRGHGSATASTSYIKDCLEGLASLVEQGTAWQAWRRKAEEDLKLSVWKQGTLPTPEIESALSRGLDNLLCHIRAASVVEMWEQKLDRLEHSGTWGETLVKQYQANPNQQGFWDRARKQARRLAEQQKAYRMVRYVGETARNYGFTAWVDTWLEGEEPQLPRQDWCQAWIRTVLMQRMATLPLSEELNTSLAEYSALLLTRQQYLEKLVALRTWQHMALRSSLESRRALKDYASTVRKQGSGQGKRAARYRAHARVVMASAFQNIGCWIMPHGRVCESLPAVLGLFDLVIIDEASQSDITALSTLLRGKKLLIVGDDQQVSPAAVGVSEAEIAEMAHSLLEQPYADKLLPGHSLFDLFSVVFADHAAMLREHFRSTPHLIAYSNHFYYHDKILPLRVPTTAERLDPQIIDVAVEGGRYAHDVNPEEAAWIVSEIQRLVNDSRYAKHDFGVVTLSSKDKQAILLRRLLGEALPPSAIMAHHIAVGPPAMFQGQERSIMFVSVGWDARNPRSEPARSRLIEQRFNVALSRARDRLYLVHSNGSRHFRPGGPLQQMLGFLGQGSEPLVLPEKEPSQQAVLGELEKALLQAGWNLGRLPAVPLLPDFVIESASGGGRLGIIVEAASPPGLEEAWTAKLRRHQILGRAGWALVYVSAPEFLLDPERVLEAVKIAATSASLSLGGGAEEKPVWFQHWDVESPHPDSGEDEGLEDASHGQEGEACESPFEREVWEALRERKYAVETQYPVGDFRIDMVVRGGGNTGLCVECDGDSFHGLEEEAKDTARQHWLEEQTGWSFWRCWYSDWQENKAECLAKLWVALDAAGVQPAVDLAAG